MEATREKREKRRARGKDEREEKRAVGEERNKSQKLPVRRL
jgi:hypothetical protein